MTPEELVSLVQKTQTLQAETQTTEIKRAAVDCPKKLFDTLSSFSNQDDGGVIIFGLDEEDGFTVSGVYDAQDLQKQVTEQCKQMSPAVRPLFTVAPIDDCVIVSAEIPAIDLTERPCFYKGKGRIKGSWKRVGESDEQMTEYEIYSYEALRKKYQDDIRVLPNCSFDSLDPSALANYLLLLKANKPHLAQLDDETIYSLMSIKRDNQVTLGAEWLFGYYPQAFIPQLCITAVKIAGTELGSLDSGGNRFEDNKRIEGPIPDMLENCFAFIRNNLKVATKINGESGKRTDVYELPLVAVRELILNALIHRDYSVHTEGKPIQVVLYSGRLEIKNPGGLYGRMSVDNLGKMQPDTRNPMIATAMETLGLTENRYSGIPTIRKAMDKAGLPAPEFVDNGSEFTAILRMKKTTGTAAQIPDESHVSPDSEEFILTFCQTPKARGEIAEALGIGSAYAMQKYIMPLIKEGKLAMTMPNKPKSKHQRFVSVN